MAKLPTIIITQQERDRLALLVDAHADDSDNGLVDSLDQEISRARIVEAGDMPPDVVTMNSRVVFRDELPKTPVGKILRKDLRAEALQKKV